MCGRYVLDTLMEDVARLFAAQPRVGAYPPRFNIAPQTPIITIRGGASPQSRELTTLLWGFVPAWASDPSIAATMINARSETVADKASFRHAFRRRRCLVPADGFYEWPRAAAAGGQRRAPRQPWFFAMADRRPFAMAGIWETWAGPDGSELDTAAILTTEANALLADVHPRMPVILPPPLWSRWLDHETEAIDDLTPMLTPLDADLMTRWPVSSRVNRAGEEGRDLIEPIAEADSSPESDRDSDDDDDRQMRLF